MKNSFNVTRNKQIIYNYSVKPVPARVRRFLDEIEEDMARGIQLGEQKVAAPTDFQKLQFVSLKLFDAIENNDSNILEVLSAYLMSRKPELNEIRIVLSDEIINLKLI
ncbi:MAG: hypothetical protein DIZ80_07185 [endosymbiont of Galathealinum brachiosum]|uniref:Uncharacterized protein n=1 Tax=endosymbiont of Galathealinum brachiosum TaxID=2200906 RepID=A0A370DGF2_9GAMM|nr:MAG: hypothetical protein DIZ80_07185 [endosymbiont of Galathealinum brachiosum]